MAAGDKVTERHAEGLSHPDGEASPGFLQGEKPHLHGQGDMIWKRESHPPAEDRDLGHRGLAIKVHADTSQSSEASSTSLGLGLHTQSRAPPPDLTPRTLQGHGSAQEPATEKRDRVGSSLGPASDPCLSKIGNLSCSGSSSRKQEEEN